MTSHASDTSHAGGAATLSAQEREELERLRAEVTDLRRGAAGQPPAPLAPRTRSARSWWRSLLAVLFIAVACVLAPLSVTSVWARSEVTDTDRYVATVAPLAHDPAIQEAITTNLTNIVFQYVDIQGIAQQSLSAIAQRDIVPPAVAAQLPALAVPLANGVRSFTSDRIGQVVASGTFATAWDQANRTAHEQLVNALTGQGGAVSVQNNAVRVDLAAFLTVVKERLVANGFTLAERIPTVNATFTVFESADVGKVQRLFNLLNTVGYWLPLILVALAALGIYLAPNHRLAFIGTGLGVAAAMAVTALALQLARAKYLNGVPPAVLPPDAAAVLFDTFVRYLREAVRALALTGLIVAVGAFLAGPSATGVTVRRWSRDTLASLKGSLGGHGPRMTRITQWVAPRARLLRGLTVAVAFAVLLLQRYRTPGLVLWLTVGVLAVFALVEFLAVQPRRGHRTATGRVPAPDM